MATVELWDGAIFCFLAHSDVQGTQHMPATPNEHGVLHRAPARMLSMLGAFRGLRLPLSQPHHHSPVSVNQPKNSLVVQVGL